MFGPGQNRLLLATIKKEQVVNDTFAGKNLVVIYDGGGHGARAFERGNHRFASAAGDTTSEILDESGRKWRVTEDALIGPNAERLARLPGHMAFWFGWFSFYPKTEVFGIKTN